MSTTAQENKKYFAGGDCVNGGREVVDAVAKGMAAARGIDAWLMPPAGNSEEQIGELIGIMEIPANTQRKVSVSGCAFGSAWEPVSRPVLFVGWLAFYVLLIGNAAVGRPYV